MRKRTHFEKAVSAALSAALLAGSLTAGASAAGFSPVKSYQEGQFSDVTATSWFRSSVEVCYELGLMGGTSASTFNPNGAFTVAEAATIAARMHNIYNGGSGTIPSASGPWYQGAVNYCIENGIFSAGEFQGYSVNATRGQLAMMLANALPDSAWTAINNITSLPDVSSSTDYYQQIFKLYNAGIFTGSDEFGMFKPYSYITRAEVATMVARCADPAQRKTLNLTPVSQLPQVTLSGNVFSQVGNGLIRYKDEETGLYGYMEASSGKAVIPARFSSSLCEMFVDGYAIAGDYKGPHYVIDTAGREIYKGSSSPKVIATVAEDGISIIECGSTYVINGVAHTNVDQCLENGYFTRNNGTELYDNTGRKILAMSGSDYSWKLNQDYLIATDNSSGKSEVNVNYFYTLDGVLTNQISNAYIYVADEGTNRLAVYFDYTSKKYGVLSSTSVLVNAMYDGYEFAPDADLVKVSTRSGSGAAYVVGPTGLLLDKPLKYVDVRSTDILGDLIEDENQRFAFTADGIYAVDVYETPYFLHGKYCYSDEVLYERDVNGAVIGTDAYLDDKLGDQIFVRYRDAATGVMSLLDMNTGKIYPNVTICDKVPSDPLKFGDRYLDSDEWFLIYSSEVNGSVRYGLITEQGQVLPATVEAASSDEAWEIIQETIPCGETWRTVTSDGVGEVLVEVGPYLNQVKVLIGPFQGNFHYDDIQDMGEGYYMCTFGGTKYLIHA